MWQRDEKQNRASRGTLRGRGKAEHEREGRVKQTAWILLVLVGLALLLSVPVIGRWAQRSPECTGKIVTYTGPHGQPVECVCLDGTLATCFDPGP